MVAALQEAHRTRWSRTDELLRLLLVEVNALRCLHLQRFGVDAETVKANRLQSLGHPSETAPKKTSLRETARQALAALRR